MLLEPDCYRVLLVSDSQLLKHAAACAEAGLGIPFSTPGKLSRSMCAISTSAVSMPMPPHGKVETCFYSEETHQIYPGQKGDWLFELGHVDGSMASSARTASVISDRPICTHSACRPVGHWFHTENCRLHPRWNAEVVRCLSRKPSWTHTASSQLPLNDALGVTKSTEYVYQPL